MLLRVFQVVRIQKFLKGSAPPPRWGHCLLNPHWRTSQSSPERNTPYTPTRMPRGKNSAGTHRFVGVFRGQDRVIIARGVTWFCFEQRQVSMCSSSARGKVMWSQAQQVAAMLALWASVATDALLLQQWLSTGFTNSIDWTLTIPFPGPLQGKPAERRMFIWTQKILGTELGGRFLATDKNQFKLWFLKPKSGKNERACKDGWHHADR